MAEIPDINELLAQAEKALKSNRTAKSRKKGRRNQTKNGSGYIYVYDEDGKPVGKHRVVMEERLGRKLLPHEAVYFKNGIKTDFSKDNLQLGIKPGKWKSVTCPHCENDIFSILPESDQEG